MDFSSKLFEKLVNDIALLPGIGKRSAVRMALHIFKMPKEQSFQLANSIINFKEHVLYCQKCHNISDVPTCHICSNPKRNHATVCVVEDIRDVMAFESTGLYQGLYHVLGGKISPIDGIGPSDLTIEALVKKVAAGEVNEVIFALSSTIEADTTNFYIYKKIKDFSVKITCISRGISFGNELEYTDEVTLGKSLLYRIPFENTFDNIH
jgi:recombination protein RecR